MKNIFILKSYGFLALMLCMSVVVSGCSRDLYEESYVSENRIQVKQEKFSEQMAVADFNENFAAGLGQYYRAHGQGEVDFSVLYDPASRQNTAMNASQEAARISDLMRMNGMSDVQANILPVRDLGPQAKVLITFNAYSASAPKDCGTLPGFANRDVSFQEEYDLGCTIETVFARQVARPKDLVGSDDNGDTADGRRAANIGDFYRSGAPNQPLDGESATDN